MSNIETSTKLARRHLQIGWWSLLLFLLLGVLLEFLIGYKVSSYFSDVSETRRLMWRLAHVHGALLGVLHIAFGITVYIVPAVSARGRLSSICLMAASVLLPVGFFTGGIVYYGGDPGPGIFVVPLGAVLLFIASLLTALGLTRKASEAE